MIPKIIHVVWIGGEMPEKELSFSKNNKKILSDYIFNLWGNENIESLIKEHRISEFVKFAIKNKKYAFASDAIKLIALEKYGGWSLDSDNEVIKPFDDFLEYSWVTGFEKYKKFSPFTAVWGAEKEHLFTKFLIDQYELNTYEFLTTVPNTTWICKILKNKGITNNNRHQKLQEFNLDIFPNDIFCGPKTEKTYALHHFKGSWL